MPEGLPAHCGHSFRSWLDQTDAPWLDVLLLNFLLMVWFIGCRVGKQPPFLRLVAMLPIRQQLSHQLRCQRYEVARVLRLYVAHTTVNDTALYQQGQLVEIKIGPS
jgi:hypothetical protein